MSRNLKVAMVFGTRPEAIKMAPLALVLREDPSIDLCLIVTGQHRQMLDQVLELFGLTPKIDLNLMKHGQTLAGLTSRALSALDDALAAESPDLVLVHGDTTTTMVSALASFYRRIPVGHVEAGLRTRDIWSPWPEEINRQFVGRIAELHFAPTRLSEQNLLDERIPSERVFVTGNTVIDALQWVSAKLDQESLTERENIAALLAQNVDREEVDSRVLDAVLEVVTGKTKLLLVTGHRRENFGDGFGNVCEAIRQIAEDYEDICVIYPVHLNPQVQRPVHRILGDTARVHLIPPLDYLPFTFLMRHAHIVLTDSGGIQEEAPGLGKPVLVTRDVTERPEAVQAGTVRLVGTDRNKILNEVSHLLDSETHYQSMAKATNPYGDGSACQRILDAILAWRSTNEKK